MKPILYDWGGANAWLFYLVNGAHNAVTDRVMALGTWLGGHGNFSLYLAILALLAVFRVARSANSRDAAPSREEALRWLAVVAVFSAGYVVDGWLIGWLKPMLDFPRPPAALAPGSVHIVGDPEYRHSLPSGHASFAMLVGASLWPVLNRLGRVLAVAFVVWVGVSRIAVGAHFPADVLAGYLKTLLAVLAVRFLVLALIRAARRSAPSG